MIQNSGDVPEKCMELWRTVVLEAWDAARIPLGRMASRVGRSSRVIMDDVWGNMLG